MRKGFTTIELIISSTLIVVITAGLAALQYFAAGSQLASFNNYLNIDQANSAMTNLVRELREAQPSDTGAYPLITLEDNQIIFYSDIDHDSKVERVRYTLTGTTLEKGVVEPTGFPIDYPLANESVKEITDSVRNLGDPLFTYYNEDWPQDQTNNPLTEASRLSDTRLIRILINLNVNPNLQKQEYILESYTNPRILKSNF